MGTSCATRRSHTRPESRGRERTEAVRTGDGCESKGGLGTTEGGECARKTGRAGPPRGGRRRSARVVCPHFASVDADDPSLFSSMNDLPGTGGVEAGTRSLTDKLRGHWVRGAIPFITSGIVPERPAASLTIGAHERCDASLVPLA